MSSRCSGAVNIQHTGRNWPIALQVLHNMPRMNATAPQLAHRACKPRDIRSMVERASHIYSHCTIALPVFPAHQSAAQRFHRSPCRSLHPNLHTRLQNAHPTWAIRPPMGTFTVACVFQNGYIVRAFRQCRPFVSNLIHERAYSLTSRWRRFQFSIFSRKLSQGEPSLIRLHSLLRMNQPPILQPFRLARRRQLRPSKSCIDTHFPDP